MTRDGSIGGLGSGLVNPFLGVDWEMRVPPYLDACKSNAGGVLAAGVRQIKRRTDVMVRD